MLGVSRNFIKPIDLGRVFHHSYGDDIVDFGEHFFFRLSIILSERTLVSTIDDYRRTRFALDRTSSDLPVDCGCGFRMITCVRCSRISIKIPHQGSIIEYIGLGQCSRRHVD